MGYTYAGQFLSHDINLDETSVLGQPVAASTLRNTNTGWLDLDTLYDFNDRKIEDVPGALDDDGRFVVAATPGGLYRDFVRNPTKATLLDQRNDEHRIVSQFTVALMTLHNKFIDGGAKFKKAKELTIKEWQAMVITDLLPALVDGDVLADVADNGNKIYKRKLAKDGVMPIEFSTAAYRLFHSRARGRYRLNPLTDGTDGNPRARLFDVGNDDEPTLTGGSPLPDLLVVEWDRFFGPTAQVSRIMDMCVSSPLLTGEFVSFS